MFTRRFRSGGDSCNLVPQLIPGTATLCKIRSVFSRSQQLGFKLGLTNRRLRSSRAPARTRNARRCERCGEGLYSTSPAAGTRGLRCARSLATYTEPGREILGMFAAAGLRRLHSLGQAAFPGPFGSYCRHDADVTTCTVAPRGRGRWRLIPAGLVSGRLVASQAAAARPRSCRKAYTSLWWCEASMAAFQS